MSDYLYVILRGTAQPSMLAPKIESCVRLQSAGKIPENILQHFRVLVTTQEQEVRIEPFIGPSSFMALFRSKTKRRVIGVLLRAIVDCCNHQLGTIGLLFLSQRRAPSAVNTVTTILEEVLVQSRAPLNQLIILDPNLKVFEILQVEAVFPKALTIGTEKPVTGFFRNYYVMAGEPDQSLLYVEKDLENEGALFKQSRHPVKVDLESVSSMIHESHRRHLRGEGIWYRSGRVYFSED